MVAPPEPSRLERVMNPLGVAPLLKALVAKYNWLWARSSVGVRGEFSPVRSEVRPDPSRLARSMAPDPLSAQYICPAERSRLGPSGSFSFVTSGLAPVPSVLALRMSPVPVVLPKSAQYIVWAGALPASSPMTLSRITMVARFIASPLRSEPYRIVFARAIDLNRPVDVGAWRRLPPPPQHECGARAARNKRRRLRYGTRGRGGIG